MRSESDPDRIIHFPLFVDARRRLERQADRVRYGRDMAALREYLAHWDTVAARAIEPERREIVKRDAEYRLRRAEFSLALLDLDEQLEAAEQTGADFDVVLRPLVARKRDLLAEWRALEKAMRPQTSEAKL
jgi:hypothetical protein